MRVWIEEEYGYRSWILITDKTEQEIIEWWKAHPSCCCLHEIPTVFAPLGQVEEVDYELGLWMAPTSRRVSFHYHEDQDSILRVGDQYYKHAGWKREWE